MIPKYLDIWVICGRYCSLHTGCVMSCENLLEANMGPLRPQGISAITQARSVALLEKTFPSPALHLDSQVSTRSPAQVTVRVTGWGQPEHQSVYMQWDNSGEPTAQCYRVDGLGFGWLLFLAWWLLGFFWGFFWDISLMSVYSSFIISFF